MVSMGGLMDFVATGFFFYSYSVFFPVIAAEFDISRTTASMGMSIFLIVTALCSPRVGLLLNLHPLRIVFSGGALLMAAGLSSMAMASSAVWLLPGVIICASGASALGQIGPPRLVINWFVRRRGMALGVAAVGISLSGVLMPPVASWLIALMDWNRALLVYAAFIALVIAPFIFFVLIERPSDVGLSPDGDASMAPLPPPIHHTRRRYTAAMLSNPSVWLLALVFGAQFCTISAVLTHMVPLGIDTGLTIAEASLLVTVTATLAVIGKVLIGGASDRIAIRSLLLSSIGMQALGTWLLFTQSHSFAALIGGAVSFGFGFGGVVPLQTQLFARNFGKSMAMAMGISRPMMLPLQILGPPLTGLIFDLNNSYYLATFFLLSIMALAAILTIIQSRFLRRAHSDGG